MQNDKVDRSDEVFTVSSLFGAQTHQALVSIRLRETEITITAFEARAVALSILEAASAADYDAIVYETGMNKLGLGFKETAKIMEAMRLTRRQMEIKKGGGTLP